MKKEKTDFLRLLMGLVIIVLLCYIWIAKKSSMELAGMAQMPTSAFEGYEDVEDDEHSLQTFKNLQLNMTPYNI